MTTKVIKALESIKDLALFKDTSLSFIGVTALAYYLEHRISEDTVALRMTGLFPNEYMIDPSTLILMR